MSAYAYGNVKEDFTRDTYNPYHEVTLLSLENPVKNPPFNNWSVNQPSAPHDSGRGSGYDLNLRNLVIDGVNGFDFVQTKEETLPPAQMPFNSDHSVVQKTYPGDMRVWERNYVDSIYTQT